MITTDPVGVPTSRDAPLHTRHSSAAKAPWRVLAAVFLGVMVALVALACGNIRTGEAEVPGIARFKMPAFPETGSNVVQVFTEMHYQPSYRSQEGPRLLPPPDSVPVTGRELRYETLGEYIVLSTPPDVAGSYDPVQVARLFQVNCTVCHGESLRGDGPIRPKMTRGPFPADLTLSLTQNAPEGEIFAYISLGGRQGAVLLFAGLESASPMPEFRLLLSEEERWWLTRFVLDH